MKIIILLFILVITHIQSFKVGFFTENLGGNQFLPTNYVHIRQSILSDRKTKLIRPEIERITENSSINKYSVLFLALQESSLKMIDEFKDLKQKFSLSDEWTCSSQYKTGITKLIEGRFALISGLCYKKSEFDLVLEKNPAGMSLRLKGGVGGCLFQKKDKKTFCFMNVHFDTQISDGAERLNALYKKIFERLNDEYKQNLVVYLIGDWNTRAYTRSISLEELPNCLENNLNSKTQCGNNQNPINFYQGDLKTILKFDELFKKYTSEEKYAKTKLNFCNNDNFYNLPFTYKYNDKLNEGDNLSIRAFDIKNVKETKAGWDDVVLHNLGWLDRVGVLTQNDAFDCKRNIEYSSIPFLRQGDHMPLVGTISL